MKAFLMHRDKDFDLGGMLPAHEAALTQDLGLTRLFNAAARGDQFLFDVIRTGVLTSLDEPDAIIYRQRILADCLAQPSVTRAIYALTVEALQAEKQVWRAFWKSPEAILSRSVEVLGILVGSLKTLRKMSDEHAAKFVSEGFTRLFTSLSSELDDAYLQTIEQQLRELKFRRGVLMSAQLGTANRGVHHVLRTLPRQRPWIERLLPGRRSGLGFQIADRDESGFRALGELRDRGINIAANAVAQSADHILAFFTMLRVELGFYVCCLNVQERLTANGEPTCYPDPREAGTVALSARGLYEVGLSLAQADRVVGNDISADGKVLVMITGANQGGKSTFLRSAGLAQLMMQCGMLVAAEEYTANVCRAVFTHFKREEDTSMKSGKLDEELRRMSDVAEEIGPSCMLLCNESFAATNEREGSEIARQIVRALTEAGVKVLYVTHQYDLAHSYYVQGLASALFLRAERQPDGTRTFHVAEGEPLPTSYGADSYRRIFGATSDRTARADAADQHLSARP
jgi:hypothetical protein